MGVRLQRAILLAASPVLTATGIAAWALITQQLKEQKVTVDPAAPALVGRPLAGPITAYAQACAIKTHAREAGEGRTFAEVTQAWRAATRTGHTELEDEIGKRRQDIMQAESLRSSMFTCVLAYGVAALTAGLGVLSAAAGTAISIDPPAGWSGEATSNDAHTPQDSPT